MSLKPCCEEFVIKMESAPEAPAKCPTCGGMIGFDRAPKQYRKEEEGVFREDWDSTGYLALNPQYVDSEIES